jgi:diguanylate cyclase (GGDEF)-like protein
MSIQAKDIREKAIRILTRLAEDLTVERDEKRLLASSLEHLVEIFGLDLGATFLCGVDQIPVLAAKHGGKNDRSKAASELAQEALHDDRSVVRSLPEGGWLVAAPLQASIHPLGVLVLQRSSPEEGPPDMELIEAVGRQIGTAIVNARLCAELRTSSNRAEALNRVTAALTSSMDLRLALPAFAQEMSSLLSFDRLIAALVNDSGDYIEVLGHPEGSSWGLGNVLPVVGSGPGAVVLNNQAIVQDDLLRSHRFIEDMRLLEEGIRSYMLLPVSSHTRSIGVLGFGAREVSAYSDVVCRRMQPLADAVALALENVRLFQKTRELSITDDVTPLYNFRFFHQILSRELKLVDRYGSMLSIIFVDLDRFKPINDTYGHLRGSRVLREVGFLLRSAVRETDYPVRYGGDEFVVILPQTEGDSAHAIGQKIQQLIEGHTFLQEEGINAQLGLSFGVATYPKDAQTKEALIRLADERMYAEKEARKGGR